MSRCLPLLVIGCANSSLETPPCGGEVLEEVGIDEPVFGIDLQQRVLALSEPVEVVIETADGESSTDTWTLTMDVQRVRVVGFPTQPNEFQASVCPPSGTRVQVMGRADLTGTSGLQASGWAESVGRRART